MLILHETLLLALVFHAHLFTTSLVATEHLLTCEFTQLLASFKMAQHVLRNLVDNFLLYDHLRINRLSWGHHNTLGLGWDSWLKHVHRLLHNRSFDRLHFYLLFLEVSHMSIVSYIKFIVILI